MKKFQKLYILALSVLFVNLANAQWATNGNNINNTNSGRVGVGTAAPAYKLDVNGNMNADTLQNTVVATTSSAGIQKIRGGDVEITIDHKNSSSLTGAFEIFNGLGNHCLNMWENGITTFYNSTTIQNPNNNAYSAAMTLQGAGLYGPSAMFKNTDAGGIDWSITTRGDDGSFNIVKVEGSTHTPFKIEPNGRISMGDLTPVAKLNVNNFASGNYGGVDFSRAIEGASTATTGIHDGVLGSAASPSSYAIWGMNTTSGGDAGHFNGDLVYTGSLLGPSDMKLKQDVQPLTDALAKIKQLKPSTYTFNAEAFKVMNLPTGKQYGFIAQELETVFPELVHQKQQHAPEGEELIDFKSVDYISMVAILTQGVQELSTELESKNAELAAMESRIARLEGLISAAPVNDVSTGSAATITDNSAQLLGNFPNPFADKTTITYFLPENVQQATLVVYDAAGQEMNSIAINDRGQGSLELTVANFTPGNYFYTIIADGRKLPMKKMNLVK